MPRLILSTKSGPVGTPVVATLLYAQVGTAGSRQQAAHRSRGYTQASNAFPAARWNHNKITMFNRARKAWKKVEEWVEEDNSKERPEPALPTEAALAAESQSEPEPRTPART